MTRSTMDVTTPRPSSRRLRLLVAIASYGDKNLELLKQLIRSYHGMAMDVDVVVLSDAPKELGPRVRVIVGLPSNNPWSLPFAHKPLFAWHLDDYDLFAYSEDDMAVSEANIHAFLRVTPSLASDELAGFLRYEVSPSAIWSLPEAHGRYHWKPDSVARRGEHTVAEFTNEHAAFYLVTQSQLRQAIASGGFLRAPYEGQYDMLCSAATDPYTSCGFRKVVCISSVDDFLIHHLSNRYAGQLGVSLADLRDQIVAQMAIAAGRHPMTSLCRAESRLSRGEWSKDYYEKPNEELLSLVPAHARQILSMGCSSGATEARLRERGATVTAAPMDSVIGATAARLGVDMIYGTLGECFDQLAGRVFDCVIIPHLLHLLPNPGDVIRQSAHLVGRGGSLVLSGPNFGSLRVRAKRVLRRDDFRKLRSFAESGISMVDPGAVETHLTASGMHVAAVRWLPETLPAGIAALLGRFGAGTWLVRAERSS